MALLEESTVRTSEGVIGRIVINRPQSLNALNADVLQGLILAIDKLELARELRVVTITGEGEKAFVAGADIPSMAQLGPRAAADYIELGQRAMRRVETCRVPVIAVVNGYALGGGMELALACDVVVASKSAKFGQPEVNLGIIPGFGGTQRLLRRCGVGATRRLVYSGEIILAEEAYRLGIVDKLVEPGDLSKEVDGFCELIAQKAPLAVDEAKRLLRLSEDRALLGGLQMEVESFLKLFGTGDREEGMSAFMQKREPKFKGK